MTRPNRTAIALIASCSAALLIGTTVSAVPVAASTSGSVPDIPSTTSGPVEVTRAGGKATLSGSVNRAWRGGTVVLLTPSGRAYSATISARGTWKLKAPRKVVKGATLQLIDAGNNYSGPIVLRTTTTGKGKAKRTNAHVTLSGASAKFGKLKIVSGTAVVKKKVAGTAASTNAKIRARNRAGVPLGGGVDGLVRMAGNRSQLRAAGDTGMGDDFDSDGIPNTFDVDDNGNLSLDMTDSASTQGNNATARVNPWTTLNLNLGSEINAHRAPVTTGDVANAVGGANSFALAYFIDQNYLFAGGAEQSLANSATAVKDAWIDCGTLTYCGGSSPSAVATGISETPGFGEVPWSSYLGQRWENGVSSAPLQPAPGNALFTLLRGGQAPTWVGSIQPRTGASTLAEFRPGDLYTLKYRVNSESQDRSLSMMLNPYFVTVPALKNQDTAVSGNSLNLSAGVASLQVYRPQRQTVAGESGDWRDIGNLHYGVIIGNNSSEFGCAPSRYSGLSGVTAGNDPSGSLNLWPLQDNATSDMTLAEGDAGLAFNLDVQGCAADNSLAAGTYNVSVVAAGEHLTGGANRATLGGMTVTVS